MDAQELADALMDALDDIAFSREEYARETAEGYGNLRRGERITKAKAKLANVLSDLKQWVNEP